MSHIPLLRKRMKFFVIASIFLFSILQVSAYPPNLVRPARFWIEGVVPIFHGDTIQKYETTIQVYQTMILDQVMWNCVASHDTTSLDVHTFMRPRYIAHTYLHNSESRVECMLYAINVVTQGGLVPLAQQKWKNFLIGLGLDASIPKERDIMKKVRRNQSSKNLGYWIGLDTLKVMRNDGWNFDGSVSKFGTPCTGNCIIYGDNGPNPYVPVNNPFSSTQHPKRYKPLLETDGNGFVFAQSHITPHIGKIPLKIAKVPIFSQTELDARQLSDPNYNYEEEAEKAIDAVKDTANSNYRGVAVEFLDNKINIAGGMIFRLRDQFLLSLEEQLLYHVGYTTVEHDAVILSWREKVKHDLIRPTSVVQDLQQKRIRSWKGPFAGIGKMSAQDWQPWIRTMPHSEFPSGSGCICTVIAQYVEAFTTERYNITSFPTTWKFEAGSSKVEPGLKPTMPVTLQFANMIELRDLCGQSRIWGGMHFRKSVPESYKLCDEVGVRAWTHWSRKLVPGSLNHLLSTSEPFNPNQ